MKKLCKLFVITTIFTLFTIASTTAFQRPTQASKNKLYQSIQTGNKSFQTNTYRRIWASKSGQSEGSYHWKGVWRGGIKWWI